MHKKVLFFYLSLLLLPSCDPFGFDDMPESSEKQLKDNFVQRSKEIYLLRNFYDSITPKDLEVYIEFESNTSIDLKVYYLTNPKYPRKALFEQWRINPYHFIVPDPSPRDTSDLAPETKSLEVVKKRLGWDDETFRKIKNYLDNADCISITNGNPTNVGFARSGMGMYFYDLFNSSLSDSMKKRYNDSCTYRLYNDSVVLEYGGGAIGPQCFPDK